jgi:hypothetical protein
MNHRGTAHHTRTSTTPTATGSNPPGSLRDTLAAVIRDRQWRQELDEQPSAAVRELGRVVITCAGTRPLLARPLIWQSDAGAESPAWHALAVTDRFAVKIDLTITDAKRMKIFASVVRFIEIADVQARWHDIEASVRRRFGGAEEPLPLQGSGSRQPAHDELAFLDAVTSHLAL